MHHITPYLLGPVVALLLSLGLLLISSLFDRSNETRSEVNTSARNHAYPQRSVRVRAMRIRRSAPGVIRQNASGFSATIT